MIFFAIFIKILLVQILQLVYYYKIAKMEAWHTTIINEEKGENKKH